MKNENYGNHPMPRHEIAAILARAKMRLFEAERKSDHSSQSPRNQLDKPATNGIVSQRQIRETNHE